jgi:hypothetical protein
MKTHAMAFAAVLLAAAQSGCMSLPPVTRGQSPSGSDSAIQTASHHHHSSPPLADQSSYNAVNPHEAIHDHFRATQTSYYNGSPGYGCPPGCPDGSCPIGYHDAYVMGPCGPACGPRHHMSYSFSRPSDLRYPDQQTTGGAIVYPYYTVKGPSCFFRDDDRREYH